MKKVYCKKYYCMAETPSEKFAFIEGEYYKIYFLDQNYCWLSLDNGMLQTFFLNNLGTPDFNEYFYFSKELRKLKLSKLKFI